MVKINALNMLPVFTPFIVHKIIYSITPNVDVSNETICFLSSKRLSEHRDKQLEHAVYLL